VVVCAGLNRRESEAHAEESLGEGEAANLDAGLSHTHTHTHKHGRLGCGSEARRGRDAKLCYAVGIVGSAVVVTSPAELKPPGDTGAPMLRSLSNEKRRVSDCVRKLRWAVGLWSKGKSIMSSKGVFENSITKGRG
jgi:hypothetical protein